MSDKKSKDTIGNATEKDEAFQIIEDELEQIRSCLGMYISKTNTDAAIHLIKEGLNNAIDEGVIRKYKENLEKYRIIVKLDEENCIITIQDSGRGIPFDRIVDSCTKKHTSTKIDRTVPWIKGLAGRNGVGMVIMNAASDFMTVISTREDYRKTVKFIDGELEELPLEKLKKGVETGTCITFAPSEKRLGQIDLTSDLVEDYLRCISYVLPNYITIEYVAQLRDSKKSYTSTFKYAGLVEDLKYLSSSLEFDPIVIRYSSKPFDLEIAFSYDKTLDDMMIDSFCNYIHTTERGTHESAAQGAICNFFTREAKRIDPNSKYEITYADCRKGLILAVNCSHEDPGFEGQHKTAVNNVDILKEGQPGLIEGLKGYFDANPSILRKVIVYLRMIAKTRLEANKIKGVKQKEIRTFLDDLEIPGFRNITDRNSEGYSEIIFTEGKSAGSSILQANNPRYQAVFFMRGPIDNVHGMSYKTMMTKEMCRNIVRVLGCGAGPNFDIQKLRWTKVIIMTDADIDGSNLASLLCNFFYRFMPDIILSGRLYIIIPPFYELDKMTLKKYAKNQDYWVYDIREYYDIVNTAAASMINLYRISDVNPIGLAETFDMEEFSKREIREFLNRNMEYLIELRALQNKTACLPVLLEYICYVKLLHGNDITTIVDYLQKRYPELRYRMEDECLYGSCEDKYIEVVIDKIFFKMAERFMYQLKKNEKLFYGLKNKSNPEDRIHILTIGQILVMIENLIKIKIAGRFKGLGEADSYLMYISTMHPKFRKLKRITVSDIKNAEDILYMLHGKSNEARAKRRKLLKDTPISRFDIDN